MTDALLVPDLALEQWPSMDRYAEALGRRLDGATTAPEWRTVRGPRYLARYWRYPRALRRHRPRLVHVLDHSYAHCLAAFPDAASVVTVHDLWPVHVMAGAAGGIRAAVRNRMLARAIGWLRRAERWIAVSEFTAGEAVRLLALPRDRITVAPNGVDAAFEGDLPADEVAATRRGWGEQPGERAAFVLHVGSCEPRKNVPALLDAVARLRRDADVRLVQIGGRFTPAQRVQLATLGIAARVRQLPRVSDEELRRAYHAADLLLLPSSYEGFGLPVLEAMACGLPVVTSGAGGLVEAAGDAGVIAGSSEPAALAEAALKLLADPTRRAALVAAGRERARALSWDATARIVAEVYAGLGIEVRTRCA